MKKELLTKERIEADLYGTAQTRSPAHAMMLFWVSLAPVLLFALLLGLVIHWIAGILAALLLIGVLIYALFLSPGKKPTREAFDDAFDVVTERLVSVSHEPDRMERYLRRNAFSELRERVVLCFSSRQWLVPYHVYQWSGEYHMSDQGVDHTSLQGDEFYLVVSKSTYEICYAYNKKLFTYQA